MPSRPADAEYAAGVTDRPDSDGTNVVENERNNVYWASICIYSLHSLPVILETFHITLLAATSATRLVAPATPWSTVKVCQSGYFK